ncbi:endostatin-like outer membrane lipoprotein LenF [Leptospira interrogans]|uniref:endostatin-like outer membrane lipoprotein LenF n=1 Tax=Leptospira interrogans TaxID=173 RepID=UPI000BBBBDBB|nr:DUF1554 domain-containing protein [Leptospira interrogans]WOT09859.1 DUF1554 domain-containing protein [Leptospira interrogans]
MKIKYKFAILSAFTLVFVACLNKSSGDDNAVLSGLISLISNEQGCVGLDCSKNRTLRSNQLQSGQSLQAAFPQGYLPYIYVTSVSGVGHNGNFGGIAGADAYCQSNIPGNLSLTGVYKAMLVDGINRVATTVGPNSTVGQKDWVFQPNQQYRRADDGGIVMTTNASGMFDFSNGARLQNPFTRDYHAAHWSSINIDWTTWAVNGIPQACDSWTTSEWIPKYAIYGMSDQVNENILTAKINFTKPCSDYYAAPLSDGTWSRLGLVCVEQPPPPKYIFVTSSNGEYHNANFGGIAGADAYCQSRIPSNIPNNRIYKAMLVDGINRVATTVGPNSTVGQKDWVFRPNQQYQRAEDGAIVMTTNSSGMIDFESGARLQNPFTSNSLAAHWSSINIDWTTWAVNGIPQACDSWTTSEWIPKYAIYGMSDQVNENILTAKINFTKPCSDYHAAPLGDGTWSNLGLVCVEE